LRYNFIVKVKLSSQDILDKKFKADVKGYAAFEVDSFLDLVLHDFQQYEKNFNELLLHIDNLKGQVQQLKQKVRELEIDNTDLKDKTAVLHQNKTVEMNMDNFQLYKKIGLLEKELYKLGIDPNKLK